MFLHVLFAEWGLRRLDSFLLLNHCNECCPIAVVVLMVMLTGYLPEKCKWSIYNVDLVDLHRQFLIRISRQIAQMDCLTACFLTQFGIDYGENSLTIF